MRSPLFYSAVGLVAASLTGVAFAEGNKDHDVTRDAPATQPAEVRINTDDGQVDAHGEMRQDQFIEPMDRSAEEAIPAAGEIPAQPDRTTGLGDAEPAVGDGAIDTRGEVEVNMHDERDHPDAIPAAGEMEAEIEVQPQREADDIGADAVRTRQDRTYRTDQPRSRDHDGIEARGEVEMGKARTAGEARTGDLEDNRDAGREDWKWNADEPHLKVHNPDKPHLSD